MEANALLLSSVAVVLVAVAVSVYAYTRMDLDRRVRIARFLGKAFVYLIAGSILLGMAVQFIR